MLTVQSTPFLTNNTQFSKPENQFWTLQIGGWTGYCIVVFLAIIRPQFDQADFNLGGQIINLAIETSTGFFLSSLLWLMIRRIVHLSLRVTLIISFTSAALLGCILNVIKLASYKAIIHQQVWYEQLNMLEFGGWLLFSVATMFIFTAIFFIMLYNNRLQNEHEMLLRAQNSAKEAQLEMLRYQLNPHFMFNTLNAISTLIYKHENDKANEMLDKLCSFLRYSLVQKNDQISTLKEELELLELYLSIEKVRFAERLNVSLAIQANTNCAKVPTLLLQPLVENAVKFGIEFSKGTGNIVISAKRIKDTLVVDVFNDASSTSQEKQKGFGIGLNNTRERLNTMFNEACKVELVSSGSNGTKVTIEMPFLCDERYA
jgi:sensor histidine kinase YesM